MKDIGWVVVIAVVLAFVVLLALREGPKDQRPVCPGPNCPVPDPWMPKPFPGPQPRPREDGQLWPIDEGRGGRGTQPFFQLLHSVSNKSSKSSKPLLDFPSPYPEPLNARVGKRRTPDGGEISLDFPESQHLRNKGGSDGAGLCVFTSLEHSANWQSIRSLLGFRDWMTRHPGGGYPAKVDAMIKRKCAEQGKPVPEYIQMEGYDPEVLRRIVAAGLMPAITYYRSPTGRYNGEKIYHMVTLAHADEKWFGVLDNNYPKSIEYMSESEFKRCHTDNGIGWTVFFLRQGPPPIPGPARAFATKEVTPKTKDKVER